MENIRIAIVEDKNDIRQSLQLLIDGSEGYECKYTYPSGEEARIGLPSDVDIVLMDIDLGKGMSGIECIGQLEVFYPEINFLMLTVYEDDEKIFNALKAGASGYLLKKSSPVKILEAIRELHEGGSPMSTQIARRVVDVFRNTNPGSEVSDD